MAEYQRFFKRIIAASQIVAVRIETDLAYVSVRCYGGEIYETTWTLNYFFKLMPSVGRWLVDDGNEKRVVDERDLLKLGEEIPNPYQEK
ncbi:hypothetical protein Edno5_0005 [Edwardsiella phage Edno5]|uniref:Uncharacterized protein n=1 Tax=Edwardsiella phage Edno5 TaxID=2419942 RepID=A0A3G3BZ44_9CAUD|nr:hypothetical protein [Edwardsiella anguillarum]YP_010052816.1 hypothetical protein KE334_gp05 [Edwardsiella phage Edno5]AKM48202.1 hypothetical protein QY76_13525 [Edwardsiella sp. EA181011]AYP69231.1 hypothetical protein Edno5_0005 [Edwardsiella phage Edno5]RFT04036.1 hypothetical protein CGL57_09955 [Edwardsiella anguillarum]RFT05313.1 hypothetical protein CGL57_01280 [Edwardsiella anguillarum]